MTITDEIIETCSQIITDYCQKFQESGPFDLLSDEIDGKTFSAEGYFTVSEHPYHGDESTPSGTELRWHITAETVIIDILNDETQYEFSRQELQRLNNKLK